MLVAVYGTLRRNQGNNLALKLDELGEYLETTIITGTMFSLGGFPGVMTGGNHTGRVVVDVYYLPEEHRDMMLKRLDALEGYDPTSGNSPSNMYVRKTTVTETGRMVFYYEWNWEPPATSRIVEDGDWVAFKERGYKPLVDVKAVQEPMAPATTC